jgi:hypothetical protein
MAASSTTDDGGIADGATRRPSRYDVHLVGIPIVLLLSVVAHVLFGLALETTLVAASLPGLFIVVDAMFLNPPTRRRGAT